MFQASHSDKKTPQINHEENLFNFLRLFLSVVFIRIYTSNPERSRHIDLSQSSLFIGINHFLMDIGHTYTFSKGNCMSLTDLFDIYLQNNALESFIRQLNLIENLKDPQFRKRLVDEYLKKAPHISLSTNLLDIFSFIYAMIYIQDNEHIFWGTSFGHLMQQPIKFLTYKIPLDAKPGEVYSYTLDSGESGYVQIINERELIKVTDYNTEKANYMRLNSSPFFSYFYYNFVDHQHSDANNFFNHFEIPVTAEEIKEINSKISKGLVLRADFALDPAAIRRRTVLPERFVDINRLLTVYNDWSRFPAGTPTKTSKFYLKSLIDRLRSSTLSDEIITLRLAFQTDSMKAQRVRHVVAISYNSAQHYYYFYDSNNPKGIIISYDAENILRELEEGYNLSKDSFGNYQDITIGFDFTGRKNTDVTTALTKIFPETGLTPLQFTCVSAGVSLHVASQCKIPDEARALIAGFTFEDLRQSWYTKEHLTYAERGMPISKLRGNNFKKSNLIAEFLFFRNLVEAHLIENRHHDKSIQHAYDQRFGLTLKS